MKNNLLIATSLLGLIATQINLDAAWKSNCNQNKKEQSNENCNYKQREMPQGMYHYDDRAGFLTLEYLFWLPHQEDLFDAIKLKIANQQGNASYKQPRFDLSSGVRVGFGGYTGDHWDVGLTGTYIYSQGSERSNSTGQIENDSGSVIIPDFNAIAMGRSFTSRAMMRINMFIGDFAIGREYFLTRRFAIHPLIGIRGYDLNENYHIRFLANYLWRGANEDFVNVSPTYFTAKQEIYGVGPRGGFDLKFYLGEHWAFVGGISGSFLLSKYRTHQKYQYKEFNESDNTFSDFTLRTRDHGLFLRTNLDGFFGLSWDTWYNCDKSRFHIALLFEASEWFQMNQLNDSLIFEQQQGADNRTVVVPDLRRHGNLGYIGGTFRLQFDF